MLVTKEQVELHRASQRFVAPEFRKSFADSWLENRLLQLESTSLVFVDKRVWERVYNGILEDYEKVKSRVRDLCG